MNDATLTEAHRRPAGRRLCALDWLAIVGGTINLLVVGTIIGWWVFG